MAIIRQNLEFMSPEEGDADAARQNKIVFMGFKAGDADFNDVTSGIGPITHYNSSAAAGAGLSDVTIGGVYTGSTTLVYHVKIATAASPDTFQYSADNGQTWSSPSTEIDNTLGPQLLSNGVTVYFGAITGHTAGDYWTSTVNAVLTTLTTPLKMAEIEVNHEGKTIGTTVVHTTGGGGVTALVGDITSGGTYTGDSAAVTYYLKIGASTTFAWSTVVDSGYSAEITITGTAQAIEKGITADFDDTTGYGVGNIYTITIGADNKARMIIRTNEGGTVGSTVVHTTGGGGITAVVGDVAGGGTYTGGPAPVTYYLKIGASTTFAWSTDNQHYGSEITITGSEQTIEKGITADFDDTTGYGVGNIYTIAVGADTVKLHSNSDFQVAGHVVSENGYLIKVFDVDGNQLNAYS